MSLADKYLRNLPTTFCAGCGNGIVLNSFIRAIDELKLDLNSFLCVSGIGCSAWIPSPYLRLDSFHTLHGRAVAYATGAKVANNQLNVVVFTGDGDGAGIGGNHLIHAARRNINLSVFLINNFVYGMTGGQLGPTTPHGARTSTSTSPYGNPERSFDLCKLVEAAGATYVARWTVFQPRSLIKSMREAILHDGFSFIEILSPCPTQYGRRNQLGIKEFISHFKRITSAEMGDEQVPVGVFIQESAPEFCKQLDKIRKEAQNKGGC